jgi:hypothetical protein
VPASQVSAELPELVQAQAQVLAAQPEREQASAIQASVLGLPGRAQ